MKSICVWIVLLSCCNLYNSLECGLSPYPDEELTGKIVGGRDCQRGQWPWQVSMWYLYKEKPEYHFCGGTVINDRWIMTAAHCLGFSPKNILVRINKYNLSATEEGEINRSVEKMISHPDWSWKTTDNDIGLIKINESLHLDKHNALKPICLPSKNSLFDMKRCMATGWGLTEYRGESPEIMQEVDMPLVPQKICRKNYKKLQNVTDNMICAGHMKGTKGVCHGDSGGPLQCQGSDGRWYEIGITSWGLGCAWEKYPGVFARVTQYLDWIKEVTSSN